MCSGNVVSLQEREVDPSKGGSSGGCPPQSWKVVTRVMFQRQRPGAVGQKVHAPTACCAMPAIVVEGGEDQVG